MTIDRSKMTQTIGGKVTREPRDESKNNPGRYFWWRQTEDKAKLANEITQTVKFLQRNQGSRLEQLTVSTRLYGNNAAYNILGSAFTRASSATTSSNSTRISYNLCSSVIDTMTAQIAKNKVVPMFITSGGIWGMQKKAENLSKFSEGISYEQKIHEKVTYQFRDGAIWGEGFNYIYRDKKDRAAIKRVLPHEIVDDLIEGIVGPIAQRHWVQIISRDDLLAEFPDKEDEIMKAMPAASEDIGGHKTAADLVTVFRSWHLRSGPKSKDGVHAVILPDTSVVLNDKNLEWEKDYFPFTRFMYSKRPIGDQGQGACERLQNLQGEINRLMILIQKSMWMGGSFKILSHISDKIPTQHFNNEIAPIIKWAGDIPPQYIAPPLIQQDIYPYVDSLIAKGYQQEGVSQLAASNLKPLGVNSGAALRTVDQIAEDRSIFVAQQIEDVYLETVRQCIEVVKDVFKDKKSYKVKFPDTSFLESIDWKDVNLDEDDYWLKAFPTSELPEEPSAKLQTVQEYAQAGWVSPRTARRLMRNPDIEMADSLANAAEDLIIKTIEAMLYEDRAPKINARPDGEWDLQLAKTISLEYMNYAKLHDCPEKRLARLRDFMAYIDDALGLTAPPAAPQMGAAQGLGGAAPMANPQPTPTSDLIPNANGVAA